MSELIDPSGRRVDYLRISVTDRCNERCLYCLPEHYSNWLPRAEVLRDEELLAVVRTAVSVGFRKFRVTGGEPLVRPGVVDFIGALAALPGVESVQLTTNGTRLPLLAQPLFDAGLRRINISLDALDERRYHAITGGELQPVLEGIKLVQRIGFPSVKLNTVLMRGKNEQEILPLLNFAAEHNVAIRFIELMPVSLTEMLSAENFLPVQEVLALLRAADDLEPLPEPLGFGPAKYFRLQRRAVTVGLIGALSDLHFCERCNKMRLTCDGKLRPCLGNHLETDLKPALRPALDLARLEDLFRGTALQKPSEHLFRNNYQPQRIMTAIGG
ncbi:MAG: GTP 3',8-cyclase MoaA [Verrucomicrobiota bacterium]|jgi:cyclic pyranopterin phosphate synthase